MNPFRKNAEELVEKAKILHERERTISLESVELVGELERRNAAGYLLLLSKDLAKRIGLSPSAFWKRAQVARTLARFPTLRELIVSGSTTVTHISLIAPYVTPANLTAFLVELPGKSSRDLKELIARFAGGTSSHSEAKRVNSMLQRALIVAETRGRRMSRSALIEEALTLWLDEWDVSAPTNRITRVS